MDSVQKVLLDHPDAIRVGEFAFRETAYGVTKRLRFIVSHIEYERERLGLRREDIRVLDLGCGTGTYVTIPLALMRYDTVGIDTDSVSIERAKQNAAAAGLPKMDFRPTRVEENSFSLPFHLVICSEVLEHQAQPKALLQAVRSVLTADGLLIVSVPNGRGYFEIESWITRRLPNLLNRADRFERWLVQHFGAPALQKRHRVEYGGEDSERDRQRSKMAQSSLATDQKHLQRFTSDKICRLVANQGFEIVSFRNNTWLAGNLLNAIIRSMDCLLSLNARVADHLPSWMVSDWLIAARKTDRLVT